MVVNVTETNFEEIIDNEKTILDFYADWCGPCKMLAPIFTQLDSEMENVTFGKVNVDEEQKLAQQFNVSTIPTLILFEDGKEVKRIKGFVSKEKLFSFIQNSV